MPERTLIWEVVELMDLPDTAMGTPSLIVGGFPCGSISLVMYSDVVQKFLHLFGFGVVWVDVGTSFDSDCGIGRGYGSDRVLGELGQRAMGWPWVTAVTPSEILRLFTVTIRMMVAVCVELLGAGDGAD
ncbi:hypothetical protein FPQ18DRAFT_300860 [Pyronema domesticum]|nr:hypothetical protein FPQ18DRAFT_300860 [Pyronema domesticum]